MWMLTRHGTRYPSKKAIRQLLTLGRLRDQIVYNHETRGSEYMSLYLFLVRFFFMFK